MPGNERPHQPGEGGKDQQHEQEHEQRRAYLDARRFADMEIAGRAYGEAQRALRHDAQDSDVSIYRIQTGPELIPHVVALGDVPGPALAAKLEVALALGDPVTLDADILTYLITRREEAKQLGPWVEGHHRPGEPVWLDHKPHEQPRRERRDVRKTPEQREKPKKQQGRSRRGSWKNKRH